MKNSVLAVSIFVLLCSTITAYCSPIDLLYKHRKYFEQQIEMCEVSEDPRSVQKIRTLFNEMAPKSLDEWKKKKMK
jgi:hypothetical protein